MNSSLIDKLNSFGLEQDQMEVYLYGICLLANKEQAEKTTLKQGTAWLKCFASSSGKYCKSPYLVNPYGLDSELAQALSRFAALRGATYMLSTRIDKIEPDTSNDDGVKVHKVVLSDKTEVETQAIVRSSKELRVVH